jgi:predicted dehydrogenase
MLLKWGLEEWRSKLMARGVDYTKTPAEDYATGAISFQNPDSGQEVVAQFTDSWMYDAPGLRLLMEALGPGYSYTVNSLTSPAGLFISDEAAAAVVDAEMALEKSQASSGALVLQPNEADLYGYVEEWRDAIAAFSEQRDALLDWEYGRDITRLVMAGYLSAEKGATIDLGDPKVTKDLESYIPAIQAGNGWKVLG